MNYEQFLFTRNQRRDFTAFVRPADMTNKEVSLLASAFNSIADVAALTPEHPGLYCFPLGAYTFLLRHYDSGRKHAGREIGVIEGIAVRSDEADALAARLAEIVERQADVLNVAGTIADIEAIEVGKSAVNTLTPSLRSSLRSDYGQPKDAGPLSPSPSERGEKEMQPIESEAVVIEAGVSIADGFEDNVSDSIVEKTDPPPDDDYLVDVDARLADELLVLPFSDEGRAALIEALRLRASKPLHFAFGTNSEVTGRLAEAGIEFDVVGLFNATEPVFRARARKRPAPPVRVEPPAPPLVRPPEPVEPLTPSPGPHRPLLVRLLRWLIGK